MEERRLRSSLAKLSPMPYWATQPYAGVTTEQKRVAWKRSDGEKTLSARVSHVCVGASTIRSM
jgi:hypothetical protein